MLNMKIGKIPIYFVYINFHCKFYYGNLIFVWSSVVSVVGCYFLWLVEKHVPYNGKLMVLYMVMVYYALLLKLPLLAFFINILFMVLIVLVQIPAWCTDIFLSIVYPLILLVFVYGCSILWDMILLCTMHMLEIYSGSISVLDILLFGEV